MTACGCSHCPARHDSGDACRAVAEPGGRQFTIALAGNPNSGKTTIFNALTGLRQKVANYPGVTVEKKIGLCRLPDGGWSTIIDLPGAYSLISRSPDERVAVDVLHGHRVGTPAPDVVIAVVDASNLERNLYLVSQIIEMKRPLVIALNMMDVAQRRGVHVDAAELGRQLGVPVVPVVAHRRQGIPELVRAISEARIAPVPEWPLPDIMKEEIFRLDGALDSLNGGVAALIADSGGAGRPRSSNGAGSRTIATRLLIGDEPPDLATASRVPINRLVAAAAERMQITGVDPMQADIEAHYRWIEAICARSTSRGNGWENRLQPAGFSSPAEQHAGVDVSDRIDSILIHRVWGLLIFAAIMGAMFASMFWLARPVQDALSALIGSVGTLVSTYVPGGAFKSLISDGIFAGVGSVVVFVPQIAILFLFLAVLEDSGYMSRAAFLMDRLLARVGLHGKSFIPLLSGFACAIPAIMATRTIEHRQGRLATILVLPFITCSARLPIYGLLVGTFFAGAGALAQAGIMLSLYGLGIVFAAAAAFLFRRTLLRGEGSGFILELPAYKVPQLSVIARQVWANSSQFLTRAGTTIFCICLLLWTISYFPRLPATEAAHWHDADALAGAQQAYSFAGRMGHAIEPGLRPLGFDWKMGVGCIGAFAAREVFVSTLAIVYGTGTAGGDGGHLGTAMRADRYPDGSRVWTPLVAASLLLWFVLAMQCLSTVMVVRQETGSWRWAVFMLGYMNGLAYVACLVFYQIGSRAFHW